MASETKTIRVLQGHSVEFGGVWFNQGDTLEVPKDQEYKDANGISKVETVKATKTKKEEG